MPETDTFSLWDARASYQSSNMIFSAHHSLIWHFGEISKSSPDSWCCWKQRQHVGKTSSQLPVVGRTFQFGFSRVTFSPILTLIGSLESLAGCGWGGEPVSQKNLTMNRVLPWLSTCHAASGPVGTWLGRSSGGCSCGSISAKDRSQYESPSKWELKCWLVANSWLLWPCCLHFNCYELKALIDI